MSEEPQIIIVVEGGVIQAVHSNTPIQYRIIDLDDIREKADGINQPFFLLEQDTIFEDIEETTKEIITEV